MGGNSRLLQGQMEYKRNSVYPDDELYCDPAGGIFVIVWEVPKGAGKIGIINQGTQLGWLPQIGSYKYLLNVLVVAAITVFMFIYLRYSKHGYELSVVGESERTARYVGIHVER